MATDMTITQTPTGWHLECRGFTADLNLCMCDGKKAKKTTPCPGGYHRSQVQNFAESVARTYGAPRPAVPTVPFDASLIAA